MKPFAAALICPLFACAPEARDVVRTRAANDFTCPEDKVIVRNIGGGSYRAWACGGVGTYNCLASGSNQMVCVREN